MPRAYRRREPEATVLHCVVREHLETLLAQAREASDYGHGLPRMMERELRAYLACGVLAHGFSRVKCGACGHELLVAFSCKGRGVCPSCTARRANDTAAHLVDRVLPRVPVRQYVLTFPKRIRWHLATDPSLASAALNLFLRALFAFQRRCARRDDVRDGKPGAVTFVQRFGSALNLNLHFHCVVPDGVFVEPRGAPRDAPLEFHPLRPPEDEDVEALLRKTASRVIAMLRKRGRLDAGERANDLDALGALQATSLMSSPPAPRDAYPPQASRRNAFQDGFSLHANTHLRGEDREGIERLCMYGARGPLAVSRLRELPDGRLVYRMKRKAASGADELVLQPLELLRKLVALVPPPRVHLTRFHGVFAPNAGARHRVVPEREGEEPTCASASAADAVPVPPQEPHLLRPLADEAPRNRVPWAALLRRSFEIDVFQCPNCPGRMRVVAYLDEPTVTAKILDHLGLPSHAPPIAPARERPQLELAG